MEPRPPRAARPASPQPATPYEPPDSRPQPEPQPPPRSEPRPEPQSPPRPRPRFEPRWEEPSTAPHSPDARSVDSSYRSRPERFDASVTPVDASSEARAPWYDPAGPSAPGMGVQPPASPPPGMRAGAAGGAGWFLRALIAVLAVGVLLIAAAFAYTRARDDGDDGAENEVAVAGTATRAAELALIATAEAMLPASPAPTATAAPATASPTEEATPVPTEETDEATSPTADADREPTSTPAERARLPVAELIPDVADLPDGYVIDAETDGRYSFEDVVTSLGSGQEATALLEEWDWREGRVRAFELPPNAAASPNDTSYLYVSVHRFGSEDGAVEALDYFAEIKAATGMNEVEAESLSDEMVALSGTGADGSTEVDLYIRDGSRVLRIAAFSDAGDPLADAISFAEIVLGIA